MARQAIEFHHQCALVSWFNQSCPKLSDLLISQPNGGYRNTIEAFNIKRSGGKAGIPDLFLAIPRNGFSGLWIELKSPMDSKTKPKVSESQKKYIQLLNEIGYRAVVCYGWDQARLEIMDYLNLHKK